LVVDVDLLVDVAERWVHLVVHQQAHRRQLRVQHHAQLSLQNNKQQWRSAHLCAQHLVVAADLVDQVVLPEHREPEHRE
jgi:hypothetical protein